jgi:hypothetical protein
LYDDLASGANAEVVAAFSSTETRNRLFAKSVGFRLVQAWTALAVKI